MCRIHFMEEKTEKKYTLREEIKLFLRGVKIWKEMMPGYFICQFFCVVIEIFTSYFGLYISAQLVNKLAGGHSIKSMLMLAAAAVVISFVLCVISRILRGKLNVMMAFVMDQHEEYIMREQNKLPYEYMENSDIVLLRSKIRNDFSSFGGGLYAILWTISDLLSCFFDIIFSVSLTVSMFTISAKADYKGFLGFINSPFSALAVILIIVVNSYLSIKIATTNTKKSQEALSGLSADNARFAVYARLWGTDTAIFNLHRIILEEMKKYIVHPAWVSKKEKIEIKYGTFSILLDAVLNFIIFLFVALKAFIGVFGIGNFILYQGTVGRFIRAVSGLVSTFGRLCYNNRFLVQLYSYLDLPNPMYQGTLAVEKRDDIDYEIEFRDVSFRYPKTENWALRHVNIKLKIGDKMAVVGENGSGKTTFIKLLCRLYDPTEGKILLNGIDITRYRYQEYIALFSVVFQDYTLFAFPLGENISAGLSYDKKNVRDCLFRVGMGEKLAALDADEKNTDILTKAVGRDYDREGIDFSGGEKQKIALARALYKDAPFVVLDEPTAALDPVAEAAVYETFHRVVERKTSIFISHRLSSCKFCDVVAVFDKGQIVQMGTHDILVMQKDKKYNQLWEAQAQYYR